MLSTRLESESFLADLLAIRESLSLSQQSIDSLTDKGNLAENIDFECKNEEVLECSLRSDKLGSTSLVNSSSENRNDRKSGEGKHPHMQQLDEDQFQTSPSCEPLNMKVLAINLFTCTLLFPSIHVS